MPLSEHEQKLLDEMERSLYHSEADDVATVGGGRSRAGYTAIVLGILGGVLGIALLLVGVVIRQPVVGVIGFVVMFAGALIAIAPPRRFTVERSARAGKGRPAAAKKPSFMDSLGDRWDRRADGDDR